MSHELPPNLETAYTRSTELVLKMLSGFLRQDSLGDRARRLKTVRDSLAYIFGVILVVQETNPIAYHIQPPIKPAAELPLTGHPPPLPPTDEPPSPPEPPSNLPTSDGG